MRLLAVFMFALPLACSPVEAGKKKPEAQPSKPAQLAPGIKALQLEHNRALELDNLRLRMLDMQKDAQARLMQDLQPLIEKQKALVADLDLPAGAVYQADPDNNRLLYRLPEKPEDKQAAAPAPPAEKIADKK